MHAREGEFRLAGAALAPSPPLSQSGPARFDSVNCLMEKFLFKILLDFKFAYFLHERGRGTQPPTTGPHHDAPPLSQPGLQPHAHSPAWTGGSGDAAWTLPVWSDCITAVCFCLAHKVLDFNKSFPSLEQLCGSCDRHYMLPYPRRWLGPGAATQGCSPGQQVRSPQLPRPHPDTAYAVQCFSPRGATHGSHAHPRFGLLPALNSTSDSSHKLQVS